MAPFRVRTSRPRRWVVLTLTALVISFASSGCRASTDPSAEPNPRTGTITVSAAASLQETFTDIAEAFEATHPGVSVELVFGSSSALAQQILNGAPVDVLATADERSMERVVTASAVRGKPTVFASTSLELIVRRGNPANVTSITDLTRPGVVYVTCAPEVPVGNYAAQVLDRAGVRVVPASFEQDVKGIVAKVIAGEADTGLVYATDIRATDGAATGIALPTMINISAMFPIAALADSTNVELQNAWIAFVTGNEGQAILVEHGFSTP